jgi:SAM-dependent methyltransferase
MKNILRYNWRFYAGACAGIGAALPIALYASPPWRTLVLIGVLPALWWLCSSLLVSYYVYDRSSLYSLRWIEGCLSRSPRRWINIHAGLDETSARLAALFPATESRILDIYDPREMTEPSIAEARRVTPSRLQATPADWRALPLPDHAVDTAFLIFAAHELRRPSSRAQLFREIARVLRGGGELVVVEHLRDWANFFAFGPGFLHFLPERAWRHAADAAGLRVRRRTSLTPFVHVFVLRSPA